MRTFFLSLALVFIISPVVFAVPSGRTLTFDKNSQGVVVFDGSKHSEAGLICTDCHKQGVFPKMKKGSAKITMNAIRAGKFCGACHNGKNSFSPDGNCDRCHKPAKK